MVWFDFPVRGSPGSATRTRAVLFHQFVTTTSSFLMKMCSVEGCDRQVHALGLCITCYNREYKRKYRQKPENRVKLNEYQRKYQQSEKSKIYHREYKRQPKYREWDRKWKRQRYTGFSPALVEELLTFQKGRCAICTVHLQLRGRTNDALRPDHCHTSGRPRGLLCNLCNRTLGGYETHQRPAGLRIEPYEIYLANPPVYQLFTVTSTVEVLELSTVPAATSAFTTTDATPTLPATLEAEGTLY